MPNLYNLKKSAVEDEEGKVIKNKTDNIQFVISNADIPELDDYGIDDDIEMHIKAKVVKITKPKLQDNEQKLEEPSDVTLELIEAEIMNMKVDRKRAEKMGVDMSTYKKIQQKRGGGVMK